MVPEDPLGAALIETRRQTREQVTAVWQTQMERLREAMSRDWREQVGRVIDERFTDFERSLKQRVLEAQREVVRSFGRHWNECLGRMRGAESDREWCEALLDAASGLARHSAFFSVKGESICFQGSRGFDRMLHEAPGEIPVQSAAAFLEVILSGVTAESSCSAADLSPALADAFGLVGERALLVPVSTRDRVAGVLFAANALEPAGVEAVAAIAGIVLDSRLHSGEERKAAGPVVRRIAEELAAPAAAESIAGPVAVAVPEPAAIRAALPPPQVDRRAERAARLAVSRLMLDRYGEVRKGREAGNLQAHLGPEIEQLRAGFAYAPEVLEAHLVQMLAGGNAEWMRR